jgi:hypothetical protein
LKERRRKTPSKIKNDSDQAGEGTKHPIITSDPFIFKNF